MSPSTKHAAFTLDAVYSSLMPRMKGTESSLNQLVNSMGPNHSTMDLLKLQGKMQEWTLAAQLNSALIKELGDAMKGIVQKAA